MEKGKVKVTPVDLMPWSIYTDLQLEKNYGAVIKSFQNVGEEGCEICCRKYELNSGTQIDSIPKNTAYFIESTPIINEVNMNAKRRGLDTTALILYGGNPLFD